VKVKGKHVILSLVLLVTGFMIAFSFQFTREHRDESELTQRQWRQEDELRNKIIVQQVVNQNLQEELKGLQTQLKAIEADIAELESEKEVRLKNLIEDIERLRKVVGTVMVKGPGVEVSLSDYSYVPDGANPNDYIVHDRHVQKVVDELLVAGAEAVAINGYRISHTSYIQCIGPVINIDGNTSYAPFTISAIGEAEKLVESLNMYGGVKDQLVSDQIEVKIQQKSEIILNPFLSESG